MRYHALLGIALLANCACQTSGENRAQAIVGAVLFDGTGGPPLSDSAVVIVGERIQAAGRRTETAIPPDTNILDGSGKFLVPALLDAGTGNLSRISTLDQVRAVVAAGAHGFVGMVGDTENLPADFLSDLRNLRIVAAPSLSADGNSLDVVKRNTLRFFTAGIPIAAAGGREGLLRETELLASAGMPALDVIVAATRNSALALGQFVDRGSLQPGKRADLLLLSANPGADIRNLAHVYRRMENGVWR